MVPVSDAVTTPASWTLRAEGVWIRRRRDRIVADFTWTHRPGEIAWLIGENGTGKSSLLRVLAGRARPTDGSVVRTGPPDLTPSLLYYHPAMSFPTGATVRHWTRLLEALVPPDTADPLDPAFSPATAAPEKRLDRLSTGEAKRLLLAALLARRAPFVLLDEPYEHLSGEAKAMLTTILARRARHDVVVVATNQEIPAEAAGPIVRLDGDRAVLESTAEGVV